MSTQLNERAEELEGAEAVKEMAAELDATLAELADAVSAAFDARDTPRAKVRGLDCVCAVGEGRCCRRQ